LLAAAGGLLAVSCWLLQGSLLKLQWRWLRQWPYELQQLNGASAVVQWSPEHLTEDVTEEC